MKSLSWAEMDNMSETQLIERIRSLEHELAKPQLEPEGEITTATDQRPVIEQIVINVLNGMVGIGGIPGNKDFCDEFDMRLRAAMDVSQSPPQQPSDSAGEEVYDVAISELDTNAVNWRGATVVLAEHFERVAENISDRITHQPVSEEELEEIFANHADETPYLNFNRFKAADDLNHLYSAIKELLNR